MTTSQTSLLTEISDGKSKIPEHKLAYFRERQRNRLYNFIVGKFLKLEKEGFTRAALSRRLDKRPEQITRWLSSPGNWTLDTISDLALALYGEELEFVVLPFKDRPQRNATHNELLVHAGAARMMQNSFEQYRPPTETYGLGKSPLAAKGTIGAQL